MTKLTVIVYILDWVIHRPGNNILQLTSGDPAPWIELQTLDRSNKFFFP